MNDLIFFLKVDNSFVTHMIGAIMVFGLGMVYCWIQAVISHKMRHQAMSSALSSCTRFILSGLVTVFFIISILSSRLRLPVGILSRKGETHFHTNSIDFAQRLILTQRQNAPWRWLNI